MAFARVKLLLFFICATVMVGVSSFAYSKMMQSHVHLGVFNSKAAAKNFYEALPQEQRAQIKESQLWLDVYRSPKGFLEHHVNIKNVNSQLALDICEVVANLSVQCIVSGSEPLYAQTAIDNKQILGAKGLNLTRSDQKTAPIILSGAEPLSAIYNNHTESFSLGVTSSDFPDVLEGKKQYEAFRNQLISELKLISAAEEGQDEQALDSLRALGQQAFEQAGAAYLNDLIGRSELLSGFVSTDQDGFVDDIKTGLQKNARSVVTSMAQGALASLSSGEAVDVDVLGKSIDSFVLSSAKSLVDAGIAAVKRGDLYALRHLEVEYNLNDFKDSYFSAITTQPIYQSLDARHNVFVQGGGIFNEQSVDIDDDVRRNTVNFGMAYRHLSLDETYLLGANVFYDHQWPYNHSRVSAGIDAKRHDLNFAANYYYPLTDYKKSRRDDQGNQYEERALEGYDIEIGYEPSGLSNLTIFGKGYQYFRETDEDIRGLELSAEYDITDHIKFVGALVEENGGRDGLELALQYSVPLYDVDKPNLALAELQPAAGSVSVRDKIFDKVRRENRIRVEERLVINQVEEIITAQFSALSTSLPYVVGATPTLSGVDLPFDTTITVPNGEFGIIEFSNGAIANVSASGGGDVVLEFNGTTLTVTATNGGFVQFISGSGGITTVIVPGGTVNLLGTDIDVSDDGVTTTIQVRAGQVDVIADVGGGNQIGNLGDIISLTQATGALAALVDPALETRQEDAFTNLDLINPDPPTGDSAAPFINALPALITGPQFVGNNADIRVTFTQPVTVAGAPLINGLVGVNARSFAYEASASTSTQLVFRYTYVAADVGAASITINELDLNGGTIIGTTYSLNAVTAFTDTIVPVTDLTAPSLLSSVPVDNEASASAAADIVLNFDENVQAGIGNITITDATDGSDTQIIPIGDAQVSIVGSTVTINPSSNLELVTDYNFVIPAGVIEDTAGNDFAGLAMGDLNFTTANGSVPMFVSVTPPADGTYTSGANLDWTLTYNQAVTVTGGPPTIGLTLDSGAVSAALVSGSGTANLVFRHTVVGADLDTNGVVLANVITPAGATLVDSISMTQNADTDFTAFNPATPNVFIDQAPTLVSATPVDNATGQSVGVDVTLTFNENIQAGSGNIVFTDTDDGSGDFSIPVGDARVSIVGSVVTIDLSAQILDFNTNYEVTTAAGVFEDTGVLNLPHAGIASGDVNWQTIVDPIAGFPAATVSMAPSSTSANHENAQNVGTWQTTIDVGATPDGVIFESGATGQGIAASFDATNLVFAAGDGASTATGTDSIFGFVPIASISPGLHHFVFVAKPSAAAEIGVYMDGIRVVTETIAGGMQSGEWAGTDDAGYGLVNSNIRAGVDASAISGATLVSNLSFYTNVAPADF